MVNRKKMWNNSKHFIFQILQNNHLWLWLLLCTLLPFPWWASWGHLKWFPNSLEGATKDTEHFCLHSAFHLIPNHPDWVCGGLVIWQSIPSLSYLVKYPLYSLEMGYVNKKVCPNFSIFSIILYTYIYIALEWYRHRKYKPMIYEPSTANFHQISLFSGFEMAFSFVIQNHLIQFWIHFLSLSNNNCRVWVRVRDVIEVRDASAES